MIPTIIILDRGAYLNILSFDFVAQLGISEIFTYSDVFKIVWCCHRNSQGLVSELGYVRIIKTLTKNIRSIILWDLILSIYNNICAETRYYNLECASAEDKYIWHW